MRAIRALAPARAQFAPTGARLRVLVAALSPNPPARAGISGADAADPGVVFSAPRSRTDGYARFGARRLLRLGTPRIPSCGARPVDPGLRSSRPTSQSASFARRIRAYRSLCLGHAHRGRVSGSDRLATHPGPRIPAGYRGG